MAVSAVCRVRVTASGPVSLLIAEDVPPGPASWPMAARHGEVWIPLGPNTSMLELTRAN